MSTSSPSRGSLIKECIKRFREQAPAPSGERNVLPFCSEDFWWKQKLIDESQVDYSEEYSNESLTVPKRMQDQIFTSREESNTWDQLSNLRHSLSMSMLSSTSSVSLRSSFQDNSIGDLDRYASSLLEKCDSLMKEYAGRTLPRDRAGEVFAEREPTDIAIGSKSPNEIISPRETTDYFEYTPNERTSKKKVEPLPSGSADSIFPLYLSLSDDRTRDGHNDASSPREMQDNAPLAEVEVLPYLNDEVVYMLWSRLSLVRLEIEKCRQD